jgi:hypothetical protein
MLAAVLHGYEVRRLPKGEHKLQASEKNIPRKKLRRYKWIMEYITQ